MLKRLLKEDPVAAIRIIQRHFGFSDLVYADDTGIDDLIESVHSATLEAALQGADNALIKRFAMRFVTAKARTFIEDVDRGGAPSDPRHSLGAVRRVDRHGGSSVVRRQRETRQCGRVVSAAQH